MRVCSAIAILFILFFICGCTAIHEKSNQKNHEANVSWNCEAVPGLDSIYQKEIVLFGELHGTNEIPMMFGKVACNIISNQAGKRILIGLELPADFDREFLKIGKVPERQILSEIDQMDFWSEMKDGRHSRAMRELTLRLISYANNSRGRVFLIAFERPNIDSNGAAAILSRMAAVHADQTLILVGNNHARRERMPNGPEYSPMGENLGSSSKSIVSLDGRFEAGHAWVCIKQCAARSISRAFNVGRDGEFVELKQGIQAYDGYFHIPQLTVSYSDRAPVK